MRWISLGALFGGLSVLLGAFGAHSLKAIVTAQKLGAFQTGTQYLGYHALALILLGIVSVQWGAPDNQPLKKSGYFFVAGILMFSGSLYGLTFDGPRFLGPITPLGGLSLMIGWFTFAWTVFKKSKSQSI
ncbi:MAG: DUF423 domain-containing protein [Candidatus Nitrohelix vancouverensis]|uniref:DUF423 domain-containing protein n=1 Tax=Candidatus Nitrohelix vancouverensis TaxID=2705534 RepID=A0A7T0C2Y8_9BACT|nr:MAG: DUF423 domain-containing protein [Candidatus Nitrohelix vancouverensis]